MNAMVLRGVSIEGAAPHDLGVLGGRLVDAAEVPAGAEEIDAHGLVLLPGLVDLHTHLREPGPGTSETIATGTRAAARGGFTTVFAMANTTPTTDCVEVAEAVADSAARESSADVHVVGALTKGLGGTELADMRGMADSRARVRYFSDDGHCVTDPAIMREALIAARDVGGVVAQHSQEHRLTEDSQMNEGARAEALGLPGWPPMAEEIIIARDAIMAHHLGARVHTCHLTTKGAVDVVRWAKAQGYPLTAEATPHHMFLTEESAGENAIFKVNPPLRTQEDVDAVRDAFADGTIDVLGTDHAPHPDDQKAQDWCSAPMGMLGLEHALAVVHEVFIETGRMTWSQVAERMSRTPARIAGLPLVHDRPLRAGDEATFCLVNPSAPWRVEPTEVVSIGHNTPYAGHTFNARVVLTVRRGEVTHSPL